MINDYFYSDKYDDKIVLKYSEQEISLGLLKKYISFQMKSFSKTDTEKILVSGENGLEFIVNFFAAVFTGKEIFLSDRKTDKYFVPESFQAASEICDFPKINPDKVFINFYTSGSTAEPKIIKKSFTNLLNEQRDLCKQFDFGKNPVFVSTSTMVHMFCLTFCFMVPFFSGFVIDCERVSYPEELDSKGNYVLVSTPSFLDRIDINTFKNPPNLIISAGSKLKIPKDNLIEIYGSTETGVIAYNTGKNTFKTLDNVIIEPGNNGISVKSDYFMEEKIILNDLVEMLSRNEFILKERTDRMVKIQEKRVSLCEIENVLRKHQFIKDVLCLKHNDKLCAAVVLNDEGREFFLKNGSHKTIKDLKAFTRQKFEITPKRWRFLFEIPKNICGKIDTPKIKRIFDLNLSFPFITGKNSGIDEICLNMVFPANSNFFNGHFENFPVLPGVVQLFFANYFIENLFDVKLSKNEAKKIKFSNLILPDMPLTLKLKRKNKNFEYTYLDSDKTYSSGIFIKRG